MRTSVVRRPVVIVGLVVVAVVAVAGLYWFQPWKLWVDETVREELPAAAPASPDAPGASADTTPPAASAPEVLATGRFISHEHDTTGSVKIVRLADGSRTLRIEGLDTSSGPDLRVWLTDAPVKEGKDGWHVFDDGQYVSLGKLKGNKGDQNYALPADADLNRLTSVTIWCDRFDVSFGAAELGKAAA
ncbi:DM13 domain-containing protein [Streptomyces sp. HNM0645]|uniref:DM13 domain-containing protein n=1 Tax=Streptomyces sp. HNM0645 TaxID=2782343 RepID=UPI0024B66E29|nr:DM13 domain-containing protein [Streptomyces sp. HNM0645]MDI9887677.1 DM13 domain-containing protein [Streptomyces sp. HNM0645]